MTNSVTTFIKDSALGANLEDIEVIGQGGFGTVFKAFYRPFDRVVAVKLLNDRLRHDEIAVARFFREAQTLAQIEHPNIVKVFSCGRTNNGTPYLVMEYLSGRTLTEEIQLRHPLSLYAAKEIFDGVLLGVGALHRIGLVHRDLNPNNCIFTADGLVKIVDFGFVKYLTDSPDERLTKTGQVCGTIAYLCPELCLGGTADERADIYSLGCLLYYILTGQPPYLETSVEVCLARHVTGTPRLVHAVRQEQVVYPQLEAVIVKALAKDPKHRYQNTEEFRDDLQAVELSVPAREFQRTRRKSPLAGYLALFLALAIALMLVPSFRFWQVGQLNRETQIAELRQRSRDLSSEAADLDKVPETLRKRILNAKLELGTLLTKQAFISKMPSEAAVLEAVETYKSALPWCAGIDEVCDVFTRMCLLPAIKRNQIDSRRMISKVWSEQAQRAISQDRINDAFLLYKNFKSQDLSCKIATHDVLKALNPHVEELKDRRWRRELLQDVQSEIRRSGGHQDMSLALVLLDLSEVEPLAKDADRDRREAQAIFDRAPSDHGLPRACLLVRLAGNQLSCYNNPKLALRLSLEAKIEHEKQNLTKAYSYGQTLFYIAHARCALAPSLESISALEKSALFFRQTAFHNESAVIDALHVYCDLFPLLVPAHAEQELEYLAHCVDFPDRAHLYFQACTILVDNLNATGNTAGAERAVAAGVDFLRRKKEYCLAARLSLQQAEADMRRCDYGRAKQQALKSVADFKSASAVNKNSKQNLDPLDASEQVLSSAEIARLSEILNHPG